MPSSCWIITSTAREERAGETRKGRGYLVTDLRVAQDRNKAMAAAVSQIERQFGKGSIMRMGDEEPRKVASISTGALALDLALGVGGVPRGRIIEIFGPESSGKTTLALHIIAEAQKAGSLAAFVDAEHAFDPSYAQAIG